MPKTCFSKGSTGKRKQKGSAPIRKPLFSLTARVLAAFSTLSDRKMRGSQPRDTLPADAAGTSPTQEGSTCGARRENSRESASSKPSARSCRTLSPGQTWRWLPSTTSSVWDTTITAVSPSSTCGKRRKAKPHGALRLWTTRRLRRASYKK